jgi:hypothetical protein
MKAIEIPVIRSLIVATALLGAGGMAVAQQGAASRIVVQDEIYDYGGSTFNDLNALEKRVRQASSRVIELDMCGAGAARAMMGAAHRLRDLSLLLRVQDRSSAACAPAAHAVSVSQKAERGPAGIDDAAVAHYWRQVMP